MENNELPILENAFDLWLDNKFQYTGSTIARRWESVNPDVQKYISYLIPKDEIQKIKTYQKEIFESCVDVFVTELKEIFNNDITESKYSDSDKIERYRRSVVWLLNGSKYDNVVELLPYMKERFLVGFVRTYIGIKDIREFYKFYHINKILNYSQITPNTKETGFYKDFVEVVVVGYIRFLDWLKEKKDTPKSVDGKKDYFIGDYALMYVYEDIDINESNCKELALKYGFNSKTSGKQLKDDYSKFRNNSVRTGLSENKKEDHAKLERMKRVLTLIPDNERVKSEIQLLEKQIISFYKK